MTPPVPQSVASPQLSRRRFALLPLALAGWTVSPRAIPASLPAPASLAAELAAALQRRLPLVVMASLDGCPFCKMVRDSYLEPLRRENAQPVVQLDMGSGERVVDFDGTPRSHDEVLRAGGIRAAPTVLFFGPGGHEVAPRLVGASIPDFYGAYLDDRLRIARMKTS